MKSKKFVLKLSINDVSNIRIAFDELFEHSFMDLSKKISISDYRHFAMDVVCYYNSICLTYLQIKDLEDKIYRGDFDEKK